MARIRTIKPEFFTSEDVTELSPLARLLYVALWCEADRKGRMEWKPKTFKMRYLPADACDIESLCGEIVARGLVVLYGDGKLAYIPTFDKHQQINNREQESKLPSPEQDTSPRVSDASGTREARVSDAHEGKGKEGKGKEGKEEICGSPDGDHPPAERNDPIPYAAVVAAYNARMRSLPKVLEVNAKRRTAIRRAWLESPQRQSLEFWEAYFDECAADGFRNGTGPYRNGHENWRPDFDFLIRTEQVTKVYEAAMSRMERAA